MLKVTSSQFVFGLLYFKSNVFYNEDIEMAPIKSMQDIY